MALTDSKVENVLKKYGIKKDTYGLIKYSDEIVLKAQKKFGNILNRTSMIQIIKELKEENKLKTKATLNKFVDIVIDKMKIFKPVKILNEYKGDYITRYVTSDMYVSPYEIALSLLSQSFLSHYSALYVNDLTINNPKDIYINKEQSKKDYYLDDEKSISQGRVDYAFSKKMRQTNMIYSFTYDNISYKVHVLNSKNTNNTGVITKKVIGFSKPIRTTNVERTLIDAVVRPGYSGGVTEILDAFVRINGNNVDKIWKYLKKFNYSYPYYKSVAFYLKYANYDYQAEFDKYKNDPRNNLDFYLDYQMPNTQKDEELGIFYPKSILKK